MKPILVDVYLSVTDETYYPLVPRSKYNDFYSAQSQDEMRRLIERDGWKRCGMVLSNDGKTPLPMFGKKSTAAERHSAGNNFSDSENHLIAIAGEN